MNTNAIRSQKSSLPSRRQFRPEVLGLEERMMMASGPAVVSAHLTATPVTAIDAANLPLSVKRVPGFLAGWKVDNLATPYDSVSNTGRMIDDKAVDYWKITLNQGDAVALSLTTPGSTPPPKGFVFRIWGPDNKEILAANKQPVSGTKLTYVAAGVGTYTIGISTSANAAYSFKPEAKQTAAPGPPLHAYSYTAQFNAYPGPKTNLVSILKEYKQGWPKWTSDQQTAYNTLTTIANANNNQGTGIRNFSGSFEQVGKATPTDIADWLKYTWAPFEAILRSDNELKTANDIYVHPADNDVLRMAYPTLKQWLDVAKPFISDQKLQDAYAHVHLLLLSANKTRTDVDTFLHNLNGWSTAYQTIVGGRPLAIAGFLTTGLTKVPEGFDRSLM